MGEREKEKGRGHSRAGAWGRDDAASGEEEEEEDAGIRPVRIPDGSGGEEDAARREEARVRVRVRAAESDSASEHDAPRRLSLGEALSV